MTSVKHRKFAVETTYYPVEGSEGHLSALPANALILVNAFDDQLMYHRLVKDFLFTALHNSL